jgi:GTP cyclohydrolase I
MVNQEKIKILIKEILNEIGENPDRLGLLDTPNRVSKMYSEIFRGYDETQAPKVTTFENGKDGISYHGMVMDEGNFFSQCEHHMAPFFGKYYFGVIYHPQGKILGLSKVARVVDYFSARLQIQERLVQQIVDYLWDALCKDTEHKPLGMALFMRGKHMCKSSRGAKKDGWMVTNCVKGAFKDNAATKEEFLKFIEIEK